MRVSIVGAGVAGLTCALELAARGAQVEVLERAAGPGAEACSWWAAGMLAPWCEEEHAGALVRALGEEGLGWWQAHYPATVQRGSLVLAHERDAAELRQFALRTTAHRACDAQDLRLLEPELADRFSRGLYFAAEAHLDPRLALAALLEQLQARGVALRWQTPWDGRPRAGRLLIDCRGLAARDRWPQLRGVRGESLLLSLPELSLQRPVRILHPRLPLYVVPRGAGRFVVGATQLESDAAGPISARSMLELLTAAYALHPAFGEAQLLEVGCGVRPALPDNQPHVRRDGDLLSVNGLYRHGFLIAPALARRVADYLLEGRDISEVMDEDHGERRLA
ncbi:MAG: FAD-dependent oxidoreductase [Gammaproteobacteria bacterium]|nr:FAD-dependent oxidoreductase [Gammaproteobacteria bacterium]MBV9698205.1 FAD-dependent oxidoreductase [Gammaproteobacteria bacterium]